MVEYNGLKPCKEEGSKESGSYSRITFSKLRSDEFLQSGRKTKTPGGLHGSKRSSWTNINTTRKSTVETRTGSLGGIQRDYVSRHGLGYESKVLIELNLASQVKDKRKSFYS